jgi:hypothetical protein
MAIDASGNIVLGGAIRNDTDFGGGPLPDTSNNPDAYVAKFSAGGAYLWARSFGSQWGDNRTHGVAVNAGGEVFATGSWEEKIESFFPHPDTARTADRFLVKLSP